MTAMGRNFRRALLLAVAMGAAAGAYAQGKVHTIVIEAMRFSPPALEVKAGDTVVWENKDPFPHTATAKEGGFDSGTIAPNRSWKFTAKKRGEFPYVCSLHPTMKAVLSVK
jgi:plastocyanin